MVAGGVKDPADKADEVAAEGDTNDVRRSRDSTRPPAERAESRGA